MKKKNRNLEDMGIDAARDGVTGNSGRYGNVGTGIGSGTRGSSFDNEPNRMPNDDFSSSDKFGRKRTESDRVKNRSIDHPDSNLENGSDFGRDSRNKR